ncbi:MAG: YggT family protein, partial [Chloroflexota bacterium]
MAQQKRERVEVIRGDGIERRQRVVETAPTGRRVFVSRFSQFLWLVVSVIVILLAIRFAFVMINANAATGFVNFIYGATDGLVSPFKNIVTTPGFDMASIIAIFVYMIVGWLII